MATSNHERIGKALELLNAGLLPFFERELKARWTHSGSPSADLLLKPVHARVRVGPEVAERGLVQRTQVWFHFRAVQQVRTRRHQQSNAVLHRVHVVDQFLFLDELQ